MTYEDILPLAKAFTPSPWVQIAMYQIRNTIPYPNKEERQKIFQKAKEKYGHLPKQ